MYADLLLPAQSVATIAVVSNWERLCKFNPGSMSDTITKRRIQQEAKPVSTEVEEEATEAEAGAVTEAKVQIGDSSEVPTETADVVVPKVSVESVADVAVTSVDDSAVVAE